jgi:hypothetical protein
VDVLAALGRSHAEILHLATASGVDQITGLDTDKRRIDVVDNSGST